MPTDLKFGSPSDIRHLAVDDRAFQIIDTARRALAYLVELPSHLLLGRLTLHARDLFDFAYIDRA